MEALKQLSVEVVGEKSGKSIIRVYTEERGWTYEKVDPDDVQAIETFSTKVMSPVASRRPLRVGK